MKQTYTIDISVVPDDTITDIPFEKRCGFIVGYRNDMYCVGENDKVIDGWYAPRGKTLQDSIDKLVVQETGLKRSGFIAFPLFKHEHGEVNLSLSPGHKFDSGVIGAVYLTKEFIKALVKCKQIKIKDMTKERYREQAESYISLELEEFNTWINGNYFAYEVKVKNSLGDTEYSSCCGGYTDEEQARRDALYDVIANYKQTGWLK